MTLPLYGPNDDPGPDFSALLDRDGATVDLAPEARPQLSHGTTVVAIRYADGVIMAGDRRATAGNLISHRTMDKVFPADRWSGVAIAGAAGPAMEMVKLFQLQLEHYEKVEGKNLTLEGKANQLSQMVRNHLPAALSGLAVVPLFAGYDRRREQGRLYQYDITGGRYEEGDYAATGSGSLHAGTVIKLGFREGLDHDGAVDLTIQALFQAADDDSATGGPDPIRGIFPLVASITADGFAQVSEGDVQARFESLVERLRSTSRVEGGAESTGV